MRGSGDAVVLEGEDDVCRAGGEAVGGWLVGGDVLVAGVWEGLGVASRSGEGLVAVVPFRGDELLLLVSRGMSNDDDDDDDDDDDVNDKDDGNDRGNLGGIIGDAPLEVRGGTPEGPGELERWLTLGGDLGTSGGDLGGGCTSARVMRRTHGSGSPLSSSGDDAGT